MWWGYGTRCYYPHWPLVVVGEFIETDPNHPTLQRRPVGHGVLTPADLLAKPAETLKNYAPAFLLVGIKHFPSIADDDQALSNRFTQRNREPLDIDHRLTPLPHHQANELVEGFDKHTSDILRATHFGFGGDPNSMLWHDNRRHNYHVLRWALRHFTPVQTLKRWRIDKRDLLQKRAYGQAPHDEYESLLVYHNDNKIMAFIMRKLNIDTGSVFPAATEKCLAFGIFLLPMLSLTVPSGYSYASAIILLSAIARRFFPSDQYKSDFSLPGSVNIIIFSFILYAAFWMGDAALRGDGLRDFDRPIRFLVAALCLAVIARTRINPAWLWIGLGFGSTGAGAVAIWQRFVDDSARANGFAHTIEFGNIAMVMGLMCIAGLYWAHEAFQFKPKRIALGGLLLIGAVAGIAASFLSGSRGAWLALIPAALTGLWWAKRLNNSKTAVLACLMLGLLVVVSLAYISPTTGVASRTGDALQQFNGYIQGDGEDNSVAIRLEIWKGAFYLFSEKPIIGWGDVEYVKEIKKLGESGFIDARTSRFSHAHNEWFNVLAKKGIIGFFILLGIYATPLLWFIKISRKPRISRNQSQSFFALVTAGIIFSLGFMATGMTQVNFNHNIGVMVYAFMIAALVGLSSNIHWSKERSLRSALADSSERKMDQTSTLNTH